MKDEPLVSLITPCYNGEKHLQRFLDSLLAQSYHSVEFFFINDGSTDKTEEIFLSYKLSLEQKGWQVIYYKQSNAGPAHALNYGLKRFSGKYLACPDSDDILYPDFISAKVEFMEQNPSCALCYCGVDLADEKDIATIIRSVQRFPQRKDPLFIDCLLGQNFSISAPALTYFFRAEDWLNAVKGRQIYDKTSIGQNWQLLLPIVYQGKCGYINKKLARYIQRAHSHNHLKKQLPLEERTRMEKELLFHVLQDIDMPVAERNGYMQMLDRHYERKLFAKKLHKYPALFSVVKFLYRLLKHI